jgi:hypothetical protein
VIGSSPLQGACCLSQGFQSLAGSIANAVHAPGILNRPVRSNPSRSRAWTVVHAEHKSAPGGAQSAVYTQCEIAPGGQSTVHAYPYSAPKLNYTRAMWQRASVHMEAIEHCALVGRMQLPQARDGILQRDVDLAIKGIVLVINGVICRIWCIASSDRGSRLWPFLYPDCPLG